MTRSRAALAAPVVVAALLLCGAAIASARPLARIARHAHATPAETLPEIDTSNAANCDFIAQPSDTTCMVPFPDDYYTTAEPSSATGLHVHFTEEGTPANVLGQHIEPGPYDEADGFSPGSVILVKVPGMETTADVKATGAVPVNRLAQLYEAERAGGGHRCEHGPALADLGGDRLERRRSVGAGPRDPPGRQLQVGRPLHRRAAQPEERGPPAPRSAGGVPLLPRQRGIEKTK